MFTIMLQDLSTTYQNKMTVNSADRLQHYSTQYISLHTEHAYVIVISYQEFFF